MIVRKNEIAGILHFGGYILHNTIYDTARLFDKNGFEIGTVRTDTLHNIHKTGQTQKQSGGWSYTDKYTLAH